MGSKEQRGAWERAAMLCRVRQKVTDELAAAFGTAGRVDVPAARRRGDAPAEAMPPGTGLIQAYTEARDSLLVLGPPGSGKSTALYELAAHLLGAAERDPELPVPVVVHLSSWARGRGRLEAWLADELADVYEVPRALAQSWLADERVLPLLDGLDEVAVDARGACAEQITTFRRRHGMVRLVLCSTAEAYQPCSRTLRLHEVMELLPLEAAGVTRYLTRAGVRLDDGWLPEPQVAEVLASPLMLSLVASAYRGGDLDPIGTGARPLRRAQVVSEMLARTMRDESGTEPPFPPGRALDWLSKLARTMRDRGAAEFRLDLVQPDWLGSRAGRKAAVLAPHLATVAVALLLSFVLYAPFAGAAPALGLAVAALALGVLITSQLGGSGRAAVEAVRAPDWRRPRSRLVRALRLAGPVAGGRPGTTGRAGGNGTGGGETQQPRETVGDRPGPAAGIDRAARSAGIAAGWVAALVLPPLIVLWAADGGESFLVRVAATVVLVLVVLALPVAMRFGGVACCQHLAVRLLLVREGRAPWRLGRLLEDAARRGLLVRTGSGYRFPHRLVLEHVAGLEHRVATTVEAPERATAPA